MRTRYLSLDAVVLRARPQGEADLWITMLAPVAGLISGVAKNGLKSQKRFMGALVPATRQDVLLARRQGAWYVEEALVTHHFPGAKADATRYALACYSIEHVLATHPHGPQAGDAFPLLVELLEHLELGEADLPLTRLAWDLRAMEALGVSPHLTDCVLCGVELAGRTFPFHGPSGGLLCPAHAAEQPATHDVSRGAVALSLALMASAFPLHDGARTAPRDRRAARAMMDAHMAWHSPVELRSRRVLEQLSRISTRRTRP
jgi:DNA repair protein RecO (recombination protein O)